MRPKLTKSEVTDFLRQSAGCNVSCCNGRGCVGYTPGFARVTDAQDKRVTRMKTAKDVHLRRAAQQLWREIDHMNRYGVFAFSCRAWPSLNTRLRVYAGYWR